jgi:NAD-dependent deacetylase
MPMDEMGEAARLASEADLCLAIGSSLVVEPAASIPRLAKNHGATLVIINKTGTPLDVEADLIIREPIGQTMRAVLDRLDHNT